jgi:hypothetical protein
MKLTDLIVFGSRLLLFQLRNSLAFKNEKKGDVGRYLAESRSNGIFKVFQYPRRLSRTSSTVEAQRN